MKNYNRFSIFTEKSNHDIAKLLKPKLVAAEKKAEKDDAILFSRKISLLESTWLSEFGSAEPRFSRKPAPTVDLPTEVKPERHVSFKF